MGNAGERWTVVGELGRGGMGRVELVRRQRDVHSRRFVRKRILNPSQSNHAESSSLHALLREEARIGGLLCHPNVVPVVDFGEDAEGPYLLMDYVEGIDLGELLQRYEGLLPLGACLELAEQTAAGLHAAHELTDANGESLNLIHRDISPQNILVGRDGIVRVTDFGIAKFRGREVKTTTNVLRGRISYMSPEALRFEPLDRRADIFSFGVLLWEVLAQHRLYWHEDSHVAAYEILNAPPSDILDYRRDVPPELEALLLSLLAKDKNDRPSDLAEVAQRLAEIRREHCDPNDNLQTLVDECDMQSVLRPVSNVAPAPRAGGPARWLMLGLACVVLGLGGAAIAWTTQSRAAPTPEIQPLPAMEGRAHRDASSADSTLLDGSVSAVRATPLDAAAGKKSDTTGEPNAVRTRRAERTAQQRRVAQQRRAARRRKAASSSTGRDTKGAQDISHWNWKD